MAKACHIALVPMSEVEEPALNFGLRFGGPVPVCPSLLKIYLGQVLVLLKETELMVPSILHSFCQEVLSIKLVVFKIF